MRENSGNVLCGNGRLRQNKLPEIKSWKKRA
jgi:hypothetical protein